MKTIQKLKLNNEVIDGLCSFFKGADLLISNDIEIATIKQNSINSLDCIFLMISYLYKEYLM